MSTEHKDKFLPCKYNKTPKACWSMKIMNFRVVTVRLLCFLDYFLIKACPTLFYFMFCISRKEKIEHFLKFLMCIAYFSIHKDGKTQFAIECIVRNCVTVSPLAMLSILNYGNWDKYSGASIIYSIYINIASRTAKRLS